MTGGRSVAERFATALSAEAEQDDDEPELLPVRLARAVARVLPVDGAGISLIADEHRAPLGASDEDAGLLERLQFTLGDGPCMQAHETRQPVFAPEDDIRRRWPAFHEQLLIRTPYRGVIALPLRTGLAGLGALDLFFRRAAAVAGVDVFEALAVGDLVTVALGEAAIWSSWSAASGPTWLHSPPARRRAQVWQAMGMTSLASDVGPAEALAVLRRRAYAAGRTVDDVAHDLVTGRAGLRQVPGGGDGPS